LELLAPIVPANPAFLGETLQIVAYLLVTCWFVVGAFDGGLGDPVAVAEAIVRVRNGGVASQSSADSTSNPLRRATSFSSSVWPRSRSVKSAEEADYGV
jgi:hypothetical protein